ncbi:glycerol-3-phosphate mitochondrial [Pyrenophora seminiperda CCB06]|uniref:Glycerol-3-phosphate mitochondrial n=1 Tax=Pyrenophora seminiperda CCB06 TaxID=1302712 RepID=A0A3M7M0R4_9PLEO|nr:glycerol-3-phosphate mitochondrial [Pyrenophora seminiperda CCB06]
MANSNDDSRRHPQRPEDNPFIAFRRFADSQVASLLNTVFTLPATIASYNNAHQAREECLFGKADLRQCDKLRDIEANIAELREKGTELFRRGDLHAVLRSSEELTELDRQAEDIRRGILGHGVNGHQHKLRHQDDAALVERVANEKGQEWGWSWDWGFPRPFDHDNRSSPKSSEEDMANDWAEAAALTRWLAEMKRHSDEFENKPRDNYEDESRMDAWLESWHWPTPKNSSTVEMLKYSPKLLEQDLLMQTAGVPWRAAYEDLIQTEQSESSHCMRNNESMAGRTRRIPISQQQFEDYVEKDMRRTQARIPITQRQLEEVMDRNGKPSCPGLSAGEEPNYEYSHDHEDQYDDPPTPKRDYFHFSDAYRGRESSSEEDQDMETEMDAYERLEAMSTSSTSGPAPTSLAQSANNAKPSILSTLTTTERTVSPDGSITTKVVLKKRFTDGREESTETVHTQRGQEEAQQRDPWRGLHGAQEMQTQNANKADKKRSGWFWSN